MFWFRQIRREVYTLRLHVATGEPTYALHYNTQTLLGAVGALGANAQWTWVQPALLAVAAQNTHLEPLFTLSYIADVDLGLGWTWRSDSRNEAFSRFETNSDTHFASWKQHCLLVERFWLLCTHNATHDVCTIVRSKWFSDLVKELRLYHRRALLVQ